VRLQSDASCLCERWTPRARAGGRYRFGVLVFGFEFRGGVWEWKVMRLLRGGCSSRFPLGIFEFGGARNEALCRSGRA